jgi:glutamate dehydrogenase (NAD(P)+)
MLDVVAGPFLSIAYVDPVEQIRGYLVIDRLVHGVAAGGLRIQPGIGVDEVCSLARNMTVKQAVARLQVGGAKAGLAMDPNAPHRRSVLARFLASLKPVIERRWSVGPDMNTTMAELEEIGREVGLPSLKIAIGRSRSIPDDEFLRRYALFEDRVDNATVNELRAPAGVYAAVRALLEHLAVDGTPRVAVQGAGSMGAGTALLASNAAMRVVAWSDDEKCLVDPEGLDVPRLRASRCAGRLPSPEGLAIKPRSELFLVPCDVLVLAAVSHAFDASLIPQLGCAGVVEAANLALSDTVERALHDAGIIVVPDVVAGVGGSFAVEALYVSKPMTGRDILQHVERKVTALVAAAIGGSSPTQTPRDAAYAHVGGVDP